MATTTCQRRGTAATVAEIIRELYSRAPARLPSTPIRSTAKVDAGQDGRQGAAATERAGVAVAVGARDRAGRDGRGDRAEADQDDDHGGHADPGAAQAADLDPFRVDRPAEGLGARGARASVVVPRDVRVWWSSGSPLGGSAYSTLSRVSSR